MIFNTTLLKALLLCTVLTACVKSFDENNRPVLGILAEYCMDFSCTYISSLDVFFAEDAGYDLVAIPSDMPYDMQTELFPKLNGLIMPGGWAPLKHKPGEFSNYTNTGGHFIDMAMKANDEGEHFPILAICNGMEMMGIYLGNDTEVLTPGFNNRDQFDSLHEMQIDNVLQSKLFQELTAEEFNLIQKENVFFFNHQLGFNVADWNNNKNLAERFNVISTNQDQNGRWFVSTVEAKEYPFYATQYHPEKNFYRWSKDKSQLSEQGLSITQKMAKSFQSEVLKSTQSFDSQIEKDAWLLTRNNPCQVPAWWPREHCIYELPRMQETEDEIDDMKEDQETRDKERDFVG